MKRRDFLKGILSTPVAAVGLSKAVTDLSVLNATPKPSEVEASEDMKKVKEYEEQDDLDDISGTTTSSWSISASPSASCESSFSEYYKANLKSLKGKK